MAALSKRDAIFLLDFIHESLSCDSKENFTQLVKKLDGLIPYNYNTCVFRKKEITREKEDYELLNINYPAEWLDLYISKNFNLLDPIIKTNFDKFELQYWDDTYKKCPPPKEFLETAEAFGLKKGYTYGARNASGTEGSLFSFSGESLEHDRRSETILTYVVPHLHQAFARITETGISNKQTGRLSPREKEVLKWIAHGKSSWDISMILEVSERTINFHVNSIMQKLDAVTRSHAVAIAFESGLIDIH
jgi:DNA-binding CsgD family transcriptional regulator